MNRERLDNLLDDWALDRLPAADARAVEAALAANAEWAEEARAHRAMLLALKAAPAVRAPQGLLAAAMARARSGEDPLADAGIDLDDLEPGADVVECIVPASTGPEAAYPPAAVLEVPRERRSARRVWQFAAAACLLVGAGITAWTLQPLTTQQSAKSSMMSKRALDDESAPMLSMSVLEGEAPTGEPLSGAALAEAESPFREDARAESLVAGDVREESDLQTFDMAELASAAEPMVDDALDGDAAKPEERALARDREVLAFSADDAPAMAKAAEANEARTRTITPELDAAPAPVLAQSAVPAAPAARRQAPAPAPAASAVPGAFGGGFGNALAPASPPSTAGGYAGRAESSYFFEVASAEFTQASAVALAASFAPRPITAGPPAPSSPAPIPDADLEHLLVQASQAGGRPASPQAAPGGGLARLALEFNSRADYEAFLVNLRAVPMIAPSPVEVVSNAAGAPTRQPAGANGAAAMRRSVVDGGVPPRPGLNGRVSANALSNAAGAVGAPAPSQLARFEIEAYDFEPRRDPRTGAITVQVTARPDR